MKELNDEQSASGRGGSERVDEKSQGPKFTLDIEGTLHEWHSATITTEEIIKLGGWDASQGAIEIDKDNNERTLRAGEVIELKPGLGFSKKVKFKRGRGVIEERIAKEIELVRRYYPALEYDAEKRWGRLADYPTIIPGWNRKTTQVAFHVPVGFPATPPYGIFVPSGLQFDGAAPQNYNDTASPTPPFAGAWGMFSWAPLDGHWRPTADLSTGSNLFNWIRGFADRFREGR